MAMFIAHLTDPHIGLTPSQTCPPLDPTEALRRALAHVRQLQPAADVLLLSGDLVDSGRARDYATLLELLQAELPTPAEGGLLVLAIPGNHDLPETARRILAPYMPIAPDAPPGCACLHVEHQGLHFIGLDTVVPGAPHGTLDPEQLAWLERRLLTCAGQPVLIFLHHPPLTSGITGMDAFGLLEGRTGLARLVAAHGNVQLIAAGHIHRPIVGALGGAPVVVLPSTSHQMELDLRPGAPLAVRLEPPMIGLYRWTPGEGMVCHFSHIQAFDGPYLC